MATKVTPLEINTPHKFSAYRNAALNTTANAATKLIFDAENFDTGNNYDTSNGRVTAPVAGFYFFNASLVLAASATRAIPLLYKNGIEVRSGTDIGGTCWRMEITWYVQLAANDYVEFFYFVDAVKAVATGQGSQFTGFLQST